MVYRVVDLAWLGSVFLLLFVVVDMFLHKKKRMLHRIIFYSFLFYIINVLQLVTGGIVVPRSDQPFQLLLQSVPFHFLSDWYQDYKNNGFDWFFWNSVKLSFFNVLLLFPMGIYLPVLFKKGSWKRVIAGVFLTSFFIELLQLTLGFFRLLEMSRSIDVDDLILNTIGGLLGFVCYRIVRMMVPLKNRKEKRLSS